jgi:hypothetical protein
MKTVGELLSAFFDKNMIQKAQGYSDLFSSWTTLTERTGIPTAAFHSRIVELERAILLVEADHPGWLQILQTKQAYLLNAVSRKFPNLEIRGISFRLSRDPLSFSPVPPNPKPVDPVVAEPEKKPAQEGPRDYFDRIEDTTFLETLKRLEKLEKGQGRGQSARKKD